MKEENSRTLHHSRSYNRLEATTKYDSFLSSLFSKQFLGNVKNELSKKTQSSRFIEPNNKNDLESSDHKIQLHILQKKLKDLTKENDDLKRTIKILTSTPHKMLETIHEGTKSSTDSVKHRQLQLNSVILSVEIRNRKQEDEEIKRLKDKIEQLELHKAVKEERLNQLLEREVRYEGELRILRIKESYLENQVKSLKESIKVQMSDLDPKPLSRTNTSEVNMILPDNNSSESTPKERFSPEDIVKLNQYFINVRKSQKSNSLLASYCEAFEIPQHMHISKLCMKKSHKEEQINEIDELIQEELPFIHSADLGEILGQNGNHARYKKDYSNEIQETSRKQSELFEGICQSLINIDATDNATANALKTSQQSLVAIDL